jgi:hypothetical protein
MKKTVLLSLILTIFAISLFGNQDADKCERLKGSWEWNGSVNEWQCINGIIDVNNTVIESNMSGAVVQNAVETNITVQASESAFSKASLPMKAAIIVGAPIVAAGAVVYYVVLAPFALVRWVFEGKR